MVALLFFALLASAASESYIRYPRASASAGSGSYSGASSSSSSFSSSSGTRVDPGPGGYGHFNAFAGNFPASSSSYFGGSGSQPLERSGVSDTSSPNNFQGSSAFVGNFPTPPSYYGYNGNQQFERSGASNTSPQQTNVQGGFPYFPFFNPFVPQYGIPYPYQPLPTPYQVPAPFDFQSFLNQYFQNLQNFQAQAATQAQQAAASSGGAPFDNNEVGGNAFVQYGPQGGYGSAKIFPKPDGGLETRFGGEDEAPQNSLGPVGSVSGSFKPPGGNSYGVFTSSASGSSDINGKKTSFKQSTIGVDDNGKVTTYTAHNP